MYSVSLSDLHRIFKKLDKNGDHYVSMDELQWLLDNMNVGSSVYELECLAGKTSLDFAEFVCFYNNTITMRNSGEMDKPEENDVEGDLFKAFEIFDVNHDGSISPEELQSALSILGLYDEHGEMNVSKMIQAYDLNSDGLLDFKEFKKMMS